MQVNLNYDIFNIVIIYKIFFVVFSSMSVAEISTINNFFREDILSNCSKDRKKSKIVACLSEIIVSDAMNRAAASDDVDTNSNPPAISIACQAEVKFQLLQKHSSLNLNPLVVSISRDANVGLFQYYIYILEYTNCVCNICMLLNRT